MALAKLIIDGELIRKPTDQMCKALTPGNFHAKGVFETLRADDKGIHHIDAHLMRLKRGLTFYNISNPLTDAAWKKLGGNILLSGTCRLRWMVWKEKRTVHYAVMALPYKAPTARHHREGLKVMVLKTNRPANARLAQVKSLDYALFADAATHAKALGMDDAILLNRKGDVFESTRANIFIFFEGKILTPPLSSGCLNGITRQQFLYAGKHLGFPIRQQPITPAMLNKASAIMLTNSLMGMIKAKLV